MSLETDVQALTTSVTTLIQLVNDAYGNLVSAETAATTAATDAAADAAASAVALASAQAALASFNGKYLGARASDPAVDNNGDALTDGVLYFNSVANQLRAWEGSQWYGVDASESLAAQAAAELAQTAAETAQAGAEAALSTAQAVQNAVETIFDSFDDRYLGSKASDPTLDNDGDALTSGQIYWNETSEELRFYNGAAWETPSAQAAASATAALASEIAAGGYEDDALLHRDAAASSATVAAASETAAGNSETQAGTYASQAGSSATAALASENAAATSATAADVSATASDDARKLLETRFLGSKTADPVLDNEGGALLEGAVFYHSIQGVTKVYSGASWQSDLFDAVQAAADAQSYRDAALVSAGQAAASSATATTQAGLAEAAKDAAELAAQQAAGTSLSGLDDTTIAGLADNDILQYDSATSKHVNRTLAAAGISAVGHTHNYAAPDHNHDGVYSLVAHNHDAAYSALGHNHAADYAPLIHNHDLAYAASGHNHDADYSDINHDHDFDELSGAIADGQVPSSAVTQHEDDLTIQTSQVTGLDAAIADASTGGTGVAELIAYGAI